MKIILLSDIHLSSKQPTSRTDDILQTGLEKLEYVFKYAYENKLSIFHAGDLTHTARDWEALEALLNLFNKYPVLLQTVYGNHDLYMRNKKGTLLSIINKASNKIIILKDQLFLPGMGIPIDLYGCSWNEEIPEPQKPNEFNMLVIHAPITNKNMNYETMDLESFAKVVYEAGYNFVLCADIHVKFDELFVFDKTKTSHLLEGSVRIINTGSMIRREYNDYNLTHKPCFGVLNFSSSKITWHNIPHKKAKDVLDKKEVLLPEINKINTTEFTQYLKEGIDKRDYKKALFEYLRDNSTDEITSIIERITEC